MANFSRIFFRKQRYDDISVSIQEHIDERIDELVEEGHARAEAESMARREFGNRTLMEERSREVWQWQKLESLLDGSEAHRPPTAPLARICDYCGADAGDWHWREYGGVQRAQQRAAAAACRIPSRNNWCRCT